MRIGVFRKPRMCGKRVVVLGPMSSGVWFEAVAEAYSEGWM